MNDQFAAPSGGDAAVCLTPPTIDLTPRAGQSNSEIDAWMKGQNRSEDVAVRLYAVALYKTKPDTGAAAEFAWLDSLTDYQHYILNAARRAKERVQYAKRKGAPVRSYRRGAELSPEQKREEARLRKQKQREREKQNAAAALKAQEDADQAIMEQNPLFAIA